jgi:hypothetical protein
MFELPNCQKHQFAAFVLSPASLVVWDDDPTRLVARAETLERMIIQYIWREDDEETDGTDEKASQRQTSVKEISPATLEEAQSLEARPIRFASPIIVSLAICLAIGCLGMGWRALALEVAVDGDFSRLALVVVAPFTLVISMVGKYPHFPTKRRMLTAV